MTSEDIDYLEQTFGDLIDYGVDGFDIQSKKINPLTYHLPEGDNCLHIGVARGDLRAVKLLVDAGLDVNERGDMGLTPLHLAYLNNKLEIAKFLIQRGANESLVDEFGRRPTQCSFGLAKGDGD